VRARLIASALALLLVNDPPARASPREALCASLSAASAVRADRQHGFVVSYRPGPNESDLPLPLRTSAFVYDNALAVIALVACGDVPSARRIGDAILDAQSHDRTFADGRVRNAYRGGSRPLNEKALLPGWWDAAANLWSEDPYQDGTATGNVAWASLGLLTLHQATGDARYLAGARALLLWIAANTADPSGSGFTGGVDGYDPAQTRLSWASTEHNVDIAAAALWFGRVSGDPAFGPMVVSARSFLDKAFRPPAGCFVLGTAPDGSLADTSHLALDTQLWPLLLPDAPDSWRAALSCAERHLGVAGGFDFDNDRDGVWVEGTAQAALVYASLGMAERAAELRASLQSDVSASGWLYATRGERVTTGLKIGPQSTSADFFYFRRPHLGATAWAALAATGWNPFTGRRVE